VIANPSASSIYSVMGGGNGCMSQTKIVSLTVLPIPSVFVSPLNSTVCLGTAVTLSASGSATSFTWYPAGLTGSTGINCSVSPANTQVYNVVGSLNTCTNNASAQVTIIQPPVLSLSLSSPTLCAQNINNSPSSINLSPSGAINYTLVGDNSVSVISPNGPVMLVQAQTPAPLLPTVSTATLIGESGVCKVSITHTFTIIPNPDIMLSPTSASVCPGQSQTFSVSGAATYTWLPMPNYTLSSANSIIAKPAITSFYSVMGSLAGCNSAIKNVVLLVLPIPNVSITPNTTTVCAGNTVTLSTLGNGTSFNWSPSQYLSSTYGANVTTNPFTTQIYTVVATLNTCTNSAVATVSAIVIPVISASAVQPTVCSGSPTNLTVVGANSFVWLPSQSLNFASGNAVIASPNTSTTYTIHGYNGVCTGSTSLFVQTVKRPDIILEAPYNQICIGGSVPITVSGAQNYTWVPTSGLIPSNSNTLVIAAPLVSTNYTVYGANSLGTVSCYQQLSYSVIVIPVIEPVASENISLCEGEKTTLFALGGNTFSWTPPYGLNVYDASRVVANPSISTIYTVDVSHNSFCGKTTTIMVTVSPRPKVFAGRDTSYNSNDAIFVNASGTGTLTWISGEDVLCKVCPKTQVFPTRNGCYVAETVNEYGCKATDDVCFVLTDEFTVYIPNTFTPNNDGKNDVFLIFGENISDISMEIYDRWGVRVFSSNDYRIGWDGTYKDAACPGGVYTTIIKYTGLDRKKYTQSGHIMLLR
jgi:gliding motility-associated-like protein